MIVERIRPRRLLDRLRRRRPHVLALFSYRYDAHLVPDLVANIAPLVDGWVCFDDRGAADAFSSEPARRSALIERARELGTAWVLAVDPDERFEIGTADRMDAMTAVEGRVVWGFHLREMYAPDAYRIDGIWGGKAQWRLFPLLDGQVFPHAVAHQPWHPVEPRYELRHSGLNLYHLKMITAQRRAARRDLYRALDPGNVMQAIGYDYLADEAGAEFETIPAGRGYRPAHVDDAGLWMAPPAAVGAT